MYICNENIYTLVLFVFFFFAKDFGTCVFSTKFSFKLKK